jgi:hypothetical protein
LKFIRRNDETSCLAKIKLWFEAEWGGSMVLPDGWFGRPYDNQHALTSATEDGDKLTIILDNNLRLTFTALSAVLIQSKTLILGPFDHLHFEWTPYGGGQTADTRLSRRRSEDRGISSCRRNEIAQAVFRTLCRHTLNSTTLRDEF